jgi:hypothetical protein
VTIDNTGSGMISTGDIKVHAIMIYNSDVAWPICRSGGKAVQINLY